MPPEIPPRIPHGLPPAIPRKIPHDITPKVPVLITPNITLGIAVFGIFFYMFMNLNCKTGGWWLHRG